MRRLLVALLLALTVAGGLLPPGALRAADPLEADPPVPPNDRFGLSHISYGTQPSTPARYRAALEAGARWNRWAAYWYDIEPAPGIFDFSAYDATIQSDTEHGLKLDVVLQGAPRFYRVMRDGIRTTLPMGLDQPVFADGTDTLGPDKRPNPGNPWARFVYTTVSRYRGKVSCWEMWNEPDFTYFWFTGDGQEHRHYVRLLQVGYLAAKAADPDALVAVGGMMFWEWTLWLGDGNTWLKAFLEELSKDPNRQANNYYFDVLPWHWYGYPDELYQVVVGARKLLEQRGIRGKQLWVNEANLPVCGDPLVRGPTACEKLKFFGSVNEQAAYVWQLFALGFAAGLDRIFVFQLYDDGAGEKGERFGLVRNDHSRRPSYLAYQMAAHYFRDVTWANRGMEGPTNTVTLLTKDKRVMVLWNESPTPATVKVAATGSNAQLIKEDGRAWLLRPDNGMHEVLLPETPPRTVGLLRVAPIGSTAFMLVEDTPIRRQ